MVSNEYISSDSGVPVPDEAEMVWGRSRSLELETMPSVPFTVCQTILLIVT